MTSLNSANAAYNNVVADLKKQFRAQDHHGNHAVEFASWEEVRETINPDHATFRLRVARVAKLPFSITPTGSGYQIVGTVGGWQTAIASTVHVDRATGNYMTAPSRIDGTLVISYRWSFGSWLSAWLYWLLRLVRRCVAIAILVAFIGVVVFAAQRWLPWHLVTEKIAEAFASPSATPTPSPEPRGRVPRVGNTV